MAPVVLITEQWHEYPNIDTCKTGPQDVNDVTNVPWTRDATEIEDGIV